MSTTFSLPDVGEGLTEAEIVAWRVKPGDEVVVNQILIEIETAKSLVELPSPQAGVIERLLVEEGDTVEVGTPIVAFVEDAVPGTDRAAPAVDAPTAASDDQVNARSDQGSPAQADRPASDDEGSGSVLVGYGVKTGSVTRRARRTSPGADRSAAPSDARRRQDPAGEAAASPLAKPPVRKLARDHGLDLAEVLPTGDRGEVTRNDILAAVRERQQAVMASGTPDEERETRIPVKSLRKATAQAVVASAFTAPHVSIFLDVDVTRTMDFVRTLRESKVLGDVRVSPLLIVEKAVMWAAKRNPMANASFTETEIVVKNYVNLGIAAATPRGLMVPNIKDADRMSFGELARATDHLVQLARSGKTPPSDLMGGTITITNVGVFGVDTGTPILNPGESVIVAFGQIRKRPWVVDGEIVPRELTTIGISADHRVVDGDVASRFLADIGKVLEEPAILLAEES